VHAQNLKIGKPNNFKVFGINVFKQKQTNKKLKQKETQKTTNKKNNKKKTTKDKAFKQKQTNTNLYNNKKTNNQTKKEAKDERWRSKLGKVHLHSISESRCESDVVLYSYINRRNGD
jgi:phage protein D